jgi:hypothetical protein
MTDLPLTWCDFGFCCVVPLLLLLMFTVESLEWATPLSIIKYPDPRLRAVNAKIAVFDQSLENLANQMFDIMYQ